VAEAKHEVGKNGEEQLTEVLLLCYGGVRRRQTGMRNLYDERESSSYGRGESIEAIGKANSP
jgi:hypothetical protein